MPPANKISTEELITDLQNVRDKLGYAPRVLEYAEHGKYHRDTVQSRFGTWTNALEAAELDPETKPDERGRPVTVSREELIEELRIGAAALGHSPSSTEMQHYGEYTGNMYHRRFGSWGDALEAANLPPTGTSVSLTFEDVLAESGAESDSDESPSSTGTV